MLGNPGNLERALSYWWVTCYNYYYYYYYKIVIDIEEIEKAKNRNRICAAFAIICK